jgi:hypothetical protein
MTVLGSFEMWCWRRLEKISWTDRERSEVVLRRVKEVRSIMLEAKSGKANWIGPIVRRNCPVKHIIEGKIQLTGRRERRLKQLLDDLEGKEITGN